MDLLFERAQKILRKRGQSLADLANALGESQQATKKKLTGNPRLDTLIEIATTLGVQPGYLIDKDENGCCQECDEREFAQSLEGLTEKDLLIKCFQTMNMMQMKMRLHEQRDVESHTFVRDGIEAMREIAEGADKRVGAMMDHAMHLITSATDNINVFLEMSQKLYSSNMEHVKKSREYLDQSIENIIALRDEMKTNTESLTAVVNKITRKIDEQTAETVKRYIEGKDEVIEKCKTATFLPSCNQ